MKLMSFLTLRLQSSTYVQHPQNTMITLTRSLDSQISDKKSKLKSLNSNLVNILRVQNIY